MSQNQDWKRCYVIYTQRQFQVSRCLQMRSSTASTDQSSTCNGLDVFKCEMGADLQQLLIFNRVNFNYVEHLVDYHMKNHRVTTCPLNSIVDSNFPNPIIKRWDSLMKLMKKFIDLSTCQPSYLKKRSSTNHWIRAAGRNLSQHRNLQLKGRYDWSYGSEDSLPQQSTSLAVKANPVT